MDQQLLDKVLACPTLPSLPAVALRVIELTNNPDVSIDELAKAIRFDQALSARILRTVNSSYYGLRERCTTIHKALLLLGMRPVKSLVLGFSLIDAVDEDDGHTGFNYREYWRRALYTAIGAREIARLTDAAEPDEAFLAGMLQDVGMIALHEALGELYDAVLAETGGDHAKLCRSELEHFEIQHPDVGAMLAEQWNFPAELTVPIRFHERPTAAPGHAADLTRCVAMGGAIHDALTEDDPTPALRRLYTRCKQWFNLTPSAVDDIIKTVADSARDVSRMFHLDTGARADATRILAAAEKQLVDLSRADPRTTYAGEELAKTFAGAGEYDPLTGAIGPAGFDQAVRAAFGHARQGEMALTVVQVKVDRCEQLTDEHGEVARDELTIGMAAILHQHFEPLGGVVCRPTPTLFSVVLPGTARPTALAACDSFLTHLHRSVGRWMPETPALHDAVTASIGLATLDRHSTGAFATPDELVTGATHALRAAVSAGGNAVHEHTPRAAAA
ncbi:MAG: HDOD domain-containing protein [Phycisphaerales bacterium]